jgi:hypothetical protein
VVPIIATSGAFASGSAYPEAFGYVSGQTVGTVSLALFTQLVPDLNSSDYDYLVVGRDTGNGDTWRGTFAATYTRLAGSPTAVSAWGSAANVATTGGASGWTVAVALVGNNNVTTVTGATGRTVNWVLRWRAQQRG